MLGRGRYLKPERAKRSEFGDRTGHITYDGRRSAMTLTSERWTNSSVRRLAGEEDPVEAITKKARGLVLQAMDHGWSGPPFDPLFLSDYLKLQVLPRGDVRD